MKKLFYLFIFPCLMLSTTIKSQTLLSEYNFGGSLEDRAYDIITTSDGNYMVAGWTSSNDTDISANNGSEDYWIAKISPSGSLLWEKNYGGSGNDYAYTIRETNDNGFILAGNTNSSNGDVGGNNGSYDTWLVKLNSAGNIEWEQNYGGSDFDFGDYAEQTADGGYIICGNSASSDGDVGGNYGLRDMWVVKTNASGSIEWEQNYGGSNYDYPDAVVELPTGSFIVAGRTNSTDNDVSSVYGGYDAWVIKISSTGSLLWEKNFGGTKGEITNALELTSDNKILLAGRTYSSDNDLTTNYGNADLWVVKMDTSGNVDWSKNYGGSGFDEAHTIKEAPDGDYIVAGSSQSTDVDASANYGSYDYWAIKINTSGTLLWEQNFGGSQWDIAYSVIPTADDNYMLAGRSESTDNDIGNNYGDFDYWLVELDDTLINTSTNPRIALQDDKVEVFPNPSDGNFTLRWEDMNVENISITDLSGKLLHSYFIARQQNSLQVDLQNIEPGMYFIRLEGEEDFRVEKVVVGD